MLNKSETDDQLVDLNAHHLVRFQWSDSLLQEQEPFNIQPIKISWSEASKIEERGDFSHKKTSAQVQNGLSAETRCSASSRSSSRST